MSRVVRKQFFCICENKDTDQPLCFPYIDSSIPLLSKYEISSLYTSCVVVEPELCGTWSETPKTGFLTTRLKYWSVTYFWSNPGISTQKCLRLIMLVGLALNHITETCPCINILQFFKAVKMTIY